MSSTQMVMRGGPVDILSGGEWFRGPMNLRMYRAGDIVARLLAGQSQFRLSHMYVEFVKNGTVFAPPAVTASDCDYYQALRLNPAADSDFLRVPLAFGVPGISNPARYLHNTVDFCAACDNQDGVRKAGGLAGLSLENGGLIVGAALAAAPSGSVSDDLVFARAYYNPQVSKAAGVHVIRWPYVME